MELRLGDFDCDGVNLQASQDALITRTNEY